MMDVAMGLMIVLAFIIAGVIALNVLDWQRSQQMRRRKH